MIIKFIRSMLKTVELIAFYFNILQLKFFHVDYGESIRMYGKLHIRNQGIFKIHDCVTINSGIKYNHTGGQFKTTIIVTNSGHLEIGDNSGLSNSSIYCNTNIKIGRNVMIGGGCRIFDTDFHSLNYERRLEQGDEGKSKNVVIDDGVFIGAGAIVLKGTNIGKRAVIGAGSVVSGNIPENQLWAGNPARFIRNLT